MYGIKKITGKYSSEAEKPSNLYQDCKLIS